MQLGLFTAIRIALFIFVSISVIALSWRSLKSPNSHGFYRFFAFEGVLIILLLNIPFWIRNPLSPLQLVSWILLLFSLLVVLQGFYSLNKLGGYGKRETSPGNYAFENTVNLVTDGIYGYIRHPMYCSLLLLAWGALFKHVTLVGIVMAVITSIFLVATAKTEERENRSFFGRAYEEYMKNTKMFIPYIF